jgi:hypothetical protein
MHLKKRLSQETVDALKKTTASAVPGEGKVEGIDFGLGPIGVALRRAFQKAAAGSAVFAHRFLEDPVLVSDA